MDIKEIICDLQFPSELSRITFISFYDYLQEYINNKKTDPDSFNNIEFFQNSSPKIVQLLMNDYINIFDKTLLHQHEKIVSKWRVWNIIFREQLSEFFRDYAEFEAYKRSQDTTQQKSIEIQSKNNLPKALISSSTPIASSSGIGKFPQQRSKRLSTIVAPPPVSENISVPHEITPSFSQYLVTRSPGQRIASPMNIPDIEGNYDNLLLSNMISNQAEPPVNAPLELIELTAPQQVSMQLTQQIIPARPSIPLTPPGTPAMSTESLRVLRPIARVRRKKKEYDVMTEDRPTKNLRYRDWDPFDIGAAPNLIGLDLPSTEMSRSELPAIKSIRIDSGGFDRLFNEIEISDEQIGPNQLMERRENINYHSTEPSTIDLLLPDLPRVLELRSLRENSNLRTSQNILPEFEARFRSMNVGDLSENELQYITTSAIVHKSNLPAQDLEELREEISPLIDLPQSSPELDNPNQNIDNPNNIQLQQPEPQDLIETLDQNIIPIEHREAQIQDQNEITQHPIIPDNYQRKDWIDILRDRNRDEPVNFKPFYSSNKRKRKRRRVQNVRNAGNAVPIAAPFQPSEVEEPAQVCLRGSLDDVLNALTDFDQANTSFAEPENQLPTDLENQSELFKSKFIKWKESYLASNPEKYQKYLKIPIETVTRDAKSLMHLRDIFQLYTLSASDVPSSTELLRETLSPEGKKSKKRILKSLSEAEIIEYFNSNTSDEEEMT